MDKKALEELAAGTRAKVHPTVFGTADGMKNAECIGGPSPAGWKSGDGRLWFPTVEGVAVIDPAHIPLNRLPPPVFVEQLLADGHAHDSASGLRLPPGTEKLEFHYTALSYLVPEKVRFRYRLEGYDHDWVDAGSRRTAFYRRMRPGAYRFHVAACNNDGVWNEDGASMEFALAPRFRETAAFYALVAVALGFAGFGAYRLRIRRHEARERELVELVSQRTKSLDRRSNAPSRPWPLPRRPIG